MVETPSIEDIMYYITKGKEAKEEKRRITDMFKMVLQDFRAEFFIILKEKEKFMGVHNDYLLL